MSYSRGVVFLALLTCACIKAPDDGMALGDPVSQQEVDQVKADAYAGVPELQAFHVGDSGVIESMETVYSSTRLKESDVYKLTSMDSDYFYFDDYKVKADTTTKYKMARTKNTEMPTPTPVPSPTPAPVTAKYFRPLEKIFEMARGFKFKVNAMLAKVTIHASTALGQQEPQQPRKMDEADLKIRRDVLRAVQAKDTDTTETTVQPLTDDSGDGGGTGQYFGLKHYKHSYVTSNCSQLKDCKVTATHIEFNELSTANGQTTQIHWVYEISKEVPGLFVIMSRCGSAITMLNNVQVPFMECSTLDTFHFGSGQTPTQE